jgi:hypothetical protein
MNPSAKRCASVLVETEFFAQLFVRPLRFLER